MSAIKTMSAVNKVIYAYITPDNHNHDGWVKIGETILHDGESLSHAATRRIYQQTHTADTRTKILWTHPAIMADGQPFNDHDLHHFLTASKQMTRKPNTEWFDFNGNIDLAEQYFYEFTGGEKPQSTDNAKYVLRPEQERCVYNTLDYMTTPLAIDEDGNEIANKYLWNAKPRFGKTLTAYDLIREADMTNVLIVTNRPAISTSWYSDFSKFIAWQTDYKFVADTTSLKDTGAINHDEYEKLANFDNGLLANTDSRKLYKQIAFVSLQDLKGSLYFGGEHDKLSWVKDTKWDMLILDEAHEAVDTFKTGIAMDNIHRDFDLYLSGTPFTAIAKQEFGDNIFTWNYTDEQDAKLQIIKENEARLARGELDLLDNPYAGLPTLTMYTYQMSEAIASKLDSGITINGEDVAYTFDLNEFFATDGKSNFIHKESVAKWLDALTINSKYPFSTNELRDELHHTFWLLYRVDSAKALAKMLKQHPVFSKYKVVFAVGSSSDEPDESLRNISPNVIDRVKQTIRENEYTITLSVGQLTTGVTIPEWTAIMMLANVKSPALYMQSAFRVQNPWKYTVNGNQVYKSNAYVFDFSPARSLQLATTFAIGLDTGSKPRDISIKEWNDAKVARLLNFMPIISDAGGQMTEISVSQAFSIPGKLQGRAVVERGFASDLIFNDLSGVFNDDKITAILNKMNGERAGKVKDADKDDDVDTHDAPKVIDNKPVVPEDKVIKRADSVLGSKVYESIESQVMAEIENSGVANATTVKKIYNDEVKQKVIDEAKNSGLTQTQGTKAVNLAASKIVEHIEKDKVQRNIDHKELEQAKKQEIRQYKAANKYEANKQAIEDKYTAKSKEIDNKHKNKLSESLPLITKKASEQAIGSLALARAEQKKRQAENSVKIKLRGFSSTIPLLLLAYGNETITLANFEHSVDEQTFLKMTNITTTEFVDLRDKGVFNEYVFNASIKEFLYQSDKLSRYYVNFIKQDIFANILPQQNNQIFTPKKVVELQLDILTKEFPDIWSDPNRTFVDFYVKSGQYLASIVRRLFAGLQDIIPDDNERIKHILEHQVYGFAPTKLIHDIVVNYLFGFAKNGKYTGDAIGYNHIVEYDWTSDFKVGDMDIVNSKLKTMFTVDDYKYLVKGDDDKVKFDVVVGNPPYQEEINGARTQIHFKFLDVSFCLANKAISMVQPLNWLEQKTLTAKIVPHLKQLNRYSNSRALFDNVGIASGVGFSLIVPTETFPDTKIIDNNRIIQSKILGNAGIDDYRVQQEVKFANSIASRIVSFKSVDNDDTNIHNDPNGEIKLWYNTEQTSKSKNDWLTVSRDQLPDDPIINKYKVMISAWGNSSDTDRISQNIFNNNALALAPGYMTTSVPTLLSARGNSEASLIARYANTRFFRRLLHIRVKSVRVPKVAFEGVPDITEWRDAYEADLSAGKLTDSIDDLDEWLWKYYKLSDETIADIKKRISKK